MVVHLPESERRAKCDQCGKTVLFLKRHILRQHGEKKRNERKFVCRFCPSGFRDSTRRKEHERIHTKEPPLKCPDCPKTFRYSQALLEHKTKHTGEKNFACNFCGKRFSRYTSKYNHEKNLHILQNGKLYDCPRLCGMQFRTNNEVMDHGEQCNGQESPMKSVQ